MNYLMMVEDAKLSLEERAKKLLRYRLTEEGEVPNPFTPDFLEQIQYLLDKKYIVKKPDKTSVSLSYAATPEGEKWAVGI